MTTVINPLTNDATQLRRQNLRNAATNGVQAMMTEWANQLRKSIEQDGFYVLIPAGREFYLYVTQDIDLAKASRHGVPVATNP